MAQRCRVNVQIRQYSTPTRNHERGRNWQRVVFDRPHPLTELLPLIEQRNLFETRSPPVGGNRTKRCVLSLKMGQTVHAFESLNCRMQLFHNKSVKGRFDRLSYPILALMTLRCLSTNLSSHRTNTGTCVDRFEGCDV